VRDAIYRGRADEEGDVDGDRDYQP
jgi:hypothetical protein